MEDTYVYISVKLYLKDGVLQQRCVDRGIDKKHIAQTNPLFWEIISEMDYSFKHDDIVEHEIVDILDTQLPEAKTAPVESTYVDPFDMSNVGF